MRLYWRPVRTVYRGSNNCCIQTTSTLYKSPTAHSMLPSSSPTGSRLSSTAAGLWNNIGKYNLHNILWYNIVNNNNYITAFFCTTYLTIQKPVTRVKHLYMKYKFNKLRWSPKQVTHLPPVWGLLLPMALTPTAFSVSSGRHRQSAQVSK